MHTYTRVLRDTYYDSVTLMSLTARLKIDLAPRELVVVMATETNRRLMESVGFDNPELQELAPTDCVIAIMTDDDESVLETIVASLERGISDVARPGSGDETFRTIPAANAALGANLAVISVPGAYAAREAATALAEGLNVMLFSDNVSVEDEIALKLTARDKGLLMMGPDCGTAIINHVGLCFANSVRRGSIGLAAASGTGLQEVSVLVDRFGGGISQAIGVGGRDLSEAVGGIMMIEAIGALAADSETSVVVLVSKPPAATVHERILAELEGVRKPVVVCFLDGEKPAESAHRYATTLAEAAVLALEAAGIEAPDLVSLSSQQERIVEEHRRPGKYVRGLYCGGTLCAEALSLSRSSLRELTSNVAKKSHEKMRDLARCTGHCLVDLGDDFFTNGRPHPMIEPTIRLDRLLQEARDPDTGVILMDFELGYGSHEDPVGTTLATIAEAQTINPDLVFVAYVCGTQTDKQRLDAQEKKLADAGVLLARSNAQAVRLATALVEAQ